MTRSGFELMMESSSSDVSADGTPRSSDVSSEISSSDGGSDDDRRRDEEDSGVHSGGDSDSAAVAAAASISKNVEHIEALLRKINEENRKTKEVLEALEKPRDTQETTTKIVLSRTSIISLKANQKKNEQSPPPPKESSEMKQDDLLSYETSIDGKKVPIVMFNCAAMAVYNSPNNSNNKQQYTWVGQKFRLSFKTANADAKLVSSLCHAHGFHESSADFNLLWTGVHPKPHAFKALLPHQRVNHFPRSYELTRKDRLYQNIERLQHAKGIKNFNFVPKTFLIPAEYAEFAATHHRMRGAWIVKPVASSRGRGIFIVNHPSQVPLDEPMVVAKYIDNPLLVNGHKWDLRLYVAVTSYDPLVIYLYEEGLVRFATVRYDASGKNLWNPCMHLCNYSINKYHSDYVKCDDPDQEDQGHKWSLSALLRHLKASGLDTVSLMRSVEDVIVKAILSVEFPVNSACKMFVPHRRNCFELYGFDILVDSDLKPWLLEVNLSPSLNCDAPIDMKIKSAMLSDLLNLAGVPAVDPVLKRAQFNRKVNELSNAMSGNSSNKEGGDDAKRSSTTAAVASTNRRTVSIETRRFAAIRLAASSTSYQQELSRMVRNAREEYQRRGGYVRIFPTADTWQNYGALLEYSSQNNLILHEQLYPNATRKAQRLNRRSVAMVGQKRFDFFRKRSQSAGPGSKVFEKSLPSSSSCTTICDEAGGDGESSPPPPPPPKPTACELRVAQYEKPLTRGHRPITKRAAVAASGASTDGKGRVTADSAARRRSEKRQRSAVLKEKIVKMIEGGAQLSEYQARKAFSVYLHCLLQRISSVDLSVSAEANGGGSAGSELAQIELVLKFLQKAALSLREPYFLKAPSTKLSGKDRAAIVAKELHEFLGHYKRETELYTAFKEEQGMVARHVFEEFVAFANDQDLEEVLTLQTKLYRCAHIFLGKCLPPAGGSRKNSLLRTAYGLSPDRNLRDKQCSMRMNARANPPVAPGFQLPPHSLQPTAKCLDISTHVKSKLEELEENALLKEEGEEEHSTQVVRLGAMIKPRRASENKHSSSTSTCTTGGRLLSVPTSTTGAQEKA